MANYRLEDLEVYQLALAFGNRVWHIVSNWDKFARFHPGSQFSEAADSISANIAEAYGRFHFRDKLNFCYFARGSIMESKDWISKAISRELISKEEGSSLLTELSTVFQKLNGYIKHLRKPQQGKK